jgi:hypothetical protein
MKQSSNVIVLGLFTLLAIQVGAQEKTKTPDATTRATPSETTMTAKKVVPLAEKNVVPLKVTVVFNEYDGEKKLSSLPYTLFLKPGEYKQYTGSIRMGVRVPIKTGESTIQYEDIGSNIDCTGQLAEDGRYVLDLAVERTSIYASPPLKEEHAAEAKIEDQLHGSQPMVRRFRAVYALMLRDGQTTQSVVGTDPLNGHVVKVDVTVNVLK